MVVAIFAPIPDFILCLHPCLIVVCVCFNYHQPFRIHIRDWRLYMYVNIVSRTCARFDPSENTENVANIVIRRDVKFIGKTTWPCTNWMEKIIAPIVKNYACWPNCFWITRLCITMSIHSSSMSFARWMNEGHILLDIFPRKRFQVQTLFEGNALFVDAHKVLTIFFTSF